MTPTQQEEIHLAGIALTSAQGDMYSCAVHVAALEAELKAAKAEHERLGLVVARAEIALAKAKSAAKKRSRK